MQKTTKGNTDHLQSYWLEMTTIPMSWAYFQNFFPVVFVLHNKVGFGRLPQYTDIAQRWIGKEKDLY